MNFVLDCNVWVSILYRNKLEKVLSALYANDKDFEPLRKLKRPRVRVLTIREFYDHIGL